MQEELALKTRRGFFNAQYCYSQVKQSGLLR